MTARYPARTRKSTCKDGQVQHGSASTMTSDTSQSLVKRIPALNTSRTFGPRSPVVNADIQAFLARCMSNNQWASYTDDEKARIMEALPFTRQIRDCKDPKVAISPPVDEIFCLNDQYLKRAVARFKRDLADGYYEKSWQNKVKQAHQERLEGKFDDFISQSTAEMFEDDNQGEATIVDDLGEQSEDDSYNGDKIKRKRSKKTS